MKFLNYMIGKIHNNKLTELLESFIRVMNKRQEFLWAHPQFEKEY
jgi:hypothetical protein